LGSHVCVVSSVGGLSLKKSKNKRGARKQGNAKRPPRKAGKRLKGRENPKTPKRPLKPGGGKAEKPRGEKALTAAKARKAGKN
jgi:hypothetical protein